MSHRLTAIERTIGRLWKLRDELLDYAAKAKTEFQKAAERRGHLRDWDRGYAGGEHDAYEVAAFIIEVEAQCAWLDWLREESQREQLESDRKWKQALTDTIEPPRS